MSKDPHLNTFASHSMHTGDGGGDLNRRRLEERVFSLLEGKAKESEAKEDEHSIKSAREASERGSK